MMVPFLLRETPKYFKDNESDTSPRIICSTYTNGDDYVNLLDDSAKFSVVVEDVIIMHTNNFVDAYSALMASFYVFNLEYPRELQGTFSFVQKYLLQISDSTKIQAKVSGLIIRLKKCQ